MKQKKQRKTLDLKKFTISKLNSPNLIKGGGGETNGETEPPPSSLLCIIKGEDGEGEG